MNIPQTRLRKIQPGFTLIELLIVVAIIAILAAIAVPNFLEAQTRAKISRVKSDQRVVATAVEAYTVEWSVTPIGFWESKQWQPSNFGIGEDAAMIYIYAQMTTPIAYMTSAPLDPFSLGTKITHTGKETTNYLAAKLYAYNSIRHQTLQKRPMADIYQKAFARGGTWMIHSLGPSYGYSADTRGKQIARIPAHEPSTSQLMGYPELIYNASNGTKSFGYIIRDNKQVY